MPVDLLRTDSYSGIGAVASVRSQDSPAATALNHASFHPVQEYRCLKLNMNHGSESWCSASVNENVLHPKDVLPNNGAAHPCKDKRSRSSVRPAAADRSSLTACIRVGTGAATLAYVPHAK